MLTAEDKLALYMPASLGETSGKMGHGCLRYSTHPIVCVIDPVHAGMHVSEVTDIPKPVPVVARFEEAVERGATALILGIAPPGGLIPAEWYEELDHAVDLGLSLVNGLHNPLGGRYRDLRPGQWIWDIRIEPAGLKPALGLARHIRGQKRVLTVGSDMAVGKMTAGLELWKEALAAGIEAKFVATGQIGITVTGAGVPLDAVRVDFAGGAIEQEVMKYEDSPLVIVEGQGSLVHPGSTSTLPLLRGSMPTHLLFCHRAGMTTLSKMPEVPIPPLGPLLTLYEDLAEVGGIFPRPKFCGVCLNTAHLSEAGGLEACRQLEQELGLPVVDPVRDGTLRILDQLR